MERIRVILILGALLAVSCRDGGEFFPADCWEDNFNPGYDVPGRADEGSPSYDNGTPVCVPQCDGKTCGPDGCGSSCGDCVEGTWCDEGTCVPFVVCTPQCTNRVCGADGCGGSCGNCGTGTTCNNAGQCVEIVGPSSEGTGDCSDGIDNDLDGNTDCQDLGCRDAEACQEQCDPDCIGKVCGADGCGGTCGVCDNGMTCNSVGQCVNPSSEGTGDCADGVDNDLDGNTDCADIGCEDAEACQEVETYTLTCKFSGYIVNMMEPTVKLTCPQVWSFTAAELDAHGHLPLFARNTGGTDGTTLEATTKSLSMKDQAWTSVSDPTPSSVFAIVDGEVAGICYDYPLTKAVTVSAGYGQAVTANCGAN